ncbi:hypothetical protein SDC9_34135 [bioreactor metagenome]|uniref:Outer membrane protein beta-barrel domain-containing protein n=1 Tax=bioreactor metagenome TaxID=1076179 RepID=A0A644V9W6_9ZZZZ
MKKGLLSFLFALIICNLIIAQDNQQINAKTLIQKLKYNLEFTSRISLIDGFVPSISFDANYFIDKRNSFGIGVGLGFKSELFKYNYNKQVESNGEVWWYYVGLAEANYYLFPIYLKYYFIAGKTSVSEIGFDVRFIYTFNYLDMFDDSVTSLPDYHLQTSYNRQMAYLETNIVFEFDLCSSNKLLLSTGFGYGSYNMVQPVKETGFFGIGQSGFKIKYLKFSIAFVF